MRKLDVLHVGLPRASSTTLQVNLFARSERFYAADNYYNGWARRLPREESTTWKKTAPEIKAYFSNWHETATENVIRVVSCEGFSIPGPTAAAVNRRVVLQRVRDLTGEPLRILLILREQKAWFKSVYWHTLSGLIRSGQATGPEDVSAEDIYEVISKPSFEREGWSLISSEAMDLHNIVTDLESTFPDSQLHLIPFEWIRTDPQRYFTAVSHALEVEEEEVRIAYSLPAEKRNLTKAEMYLFRLMQMTWPRSLWPSNVFIRRRISPMMAHINDTPAASSWSIPTSLAAQIDARARPQNQLLQDHTGLDLASLGYPV